MPAVKATIGGREYSFAPLKIKELKQIARFPEAQRRNVFDSMDTWKPYIESSMKAAGSTMPDFEDMDVDTGGAVFTMLLCAVMEASGVKMGEAQPVSAKTNGTISTDSSSPLPAGPSNTLTV